MINSELSTKNKRISLFLGRERGFAVLDSLVKVGRKIGNVLVLQQEKHELDNFTDKIISYCISHGIKYSTSKEIKPKDYADWLLESHPDIVFVMSWRFLIPERCFHIPKYGMFVVHDSLAPRYRGFSPTNWVIINGEQETGITLMYIGKEVDSGDIVDQIKINIKPSENAAELNSEVTHLYPVIVERNIDLILQGENKRVKQAESEATYGCKRMPEDGKIDFEQNSDKITCLIRGLTFPYPGAYCYYKEKKLILWEALSMPEQPQIIGRIVGRIITIRDDYVDVVTGKGILRITKIAYADEPARFLKPNTVLISYSSKLY